MEERKCSNCKNVLFDAKFRIFYFNQINKINIEIVGVNNKRHTLSLPVEQGENPVSFTLEELEGDKNVIKFDLIQGNNTIVDSLYCFVFAPVREKDGKSDKYLKIHTLYQLSGKWVGSNFFDNRNITEIHIKPVQKAPLDHTHSLILKTADGESYNSYLTYLSLGEESMFFTNPSSIGDVESNILINLPGGYVLGGRNYYRDILGSRVLLQLIDEQVGFTKEGELKVLLTKLKGIKEIKRWRFNPIDIEQVLERVSLTNSEVFKTGDGYYINDLEILLVEGRCVEKAFNLCNKHQGGDAIKILVQQIYMQPAKFLFNRGV